MSTTSSVVFQPPEVNLGTTTSWIPLTTAWPSSSGCASSFFYYPGQAGPAAWDPGFGYFAGGSARCLPPAETTWWEQDHQNGDGFTSVSIRPLVCPEAFTTAATSLRSASSTLVLCCPSGYDLQNGEPGQVVGTCMSALTSGQVLTYLGQVSGAFEQTSMTITTSSAISAIGLAGWNVATPTTYPSQSSSSSSSGGTGTSQPDTTQHSSGLSTGAMAGIGVSAAIGGIGIIALIVAVVLLRRRPKGVVQYNAVQPVQADSKEIYSGHPVHEMGINRKPVELPSQR